MKAEDRVKIVEICLDISSKFSQLASILMSDLQADSEISKLLDMQNSKDAEQMVNVGEGVKTKVTDTVEKNDNTVDEKSIDSREQNDEVSDSENVLAKIIKDNLIIDGDTSVSSDDFKKPDNDTLEAEDKDITEKVDSHVETDVNSEKLSSRSNVKVPDEFKVPFVDSGDAYTVSHVDKASKNKYSMKIVVSSASTCKILAGSFIYSEVKGAKASRDALSTLEIIKSMYKTTDFEDGRILRVDQDIADIKVATAATLFFGRAESSRVFKNEKTGEYYEPTRNKTPQSTSELENYIFNNT